MDVLSLLKFWRNAGVSDTINAGDFDVTGDEGSFFDLEFSNTNSLEDNGNIDSPTVSVINSVINGFPSDHNQQYSEFNGPDPKSNHTCRSLQTVLFNNKRKILPLDSSNTKTPRSPFRVLMLGFQNTKTKSDKKDMKCEAEEITISSLLKRDNSLRSKWSSEKCVDQGQMPSKRYSKDVVHKYLNLIKPLYVKASRRSNENVRSPENSPFHACSVTASVFSPRKEKPVGRTVFKEVCKHLSKNRSSSSAKPTASPAVRSDDSALQQDGIQSAILHCKKSYNSSSRGCHYLSRSGSDPPQGPGISIDEIKRSSI